ncbi:sensor histidine kinase [Leptolyngbya sp. AN02str]|uniref:sensor histidine kinase n=1 Tax=Leptolyngbya sp. AN02str TaxID=3423363 RepID=UPI003D314804
MIATPTSPHRLHPMLHDLTIESCLTDLMLYDRTVQLTCHGQEVNRIFESDAHLPGVILMDGDRFVGMVARQRFLEQLSRPYGIALFANRGINFLYEFISDPLLVLSGETLICDAIQHALARSPELIYEPIVVCVDAGNYQLLDVYQLLIAQSKIQELTRQLLDEKKQDQILQSEKMASLGRMVAGVAHEILNPVNFIWGNINYLSNYVQDLFQILAAYEAEFGNASPAIEQLKEELGLEFINRDLPQLIGSMKVGSERLRSIVESLKNFSRMDERDRKPIDLHQCLDNVLLILNNRLKHQIKVHKHYGELPLIAGHFGQLSQVFMNLVSNAIDALNEKTEQAIANSLVLHASHASAASVPPYADRWQPELHIATDWVQDQDNGVDESYLVIQISDNGSGIAPEHQANVFETFFTTKPLGVGTGLGLAICQQIVTEGHGGQIRLHSEVGVGTTFEVRLPYRNGSAVA